MKHWIWKKGTSTQQKWVGVIFLASIFGAGCSIFTRNFAPSTEWIQASRLICAALCAAACFMLRNIYREGKLQLGGPLLEMGPIKRIFMIPLGVFIQINFLWMAIFAPLPSLYTHYWGQDAESVYKVTAHINYGRGCRYELKVAEIQFWYFKICIDKEDYEAMKGQPLYAKLQSKQSFFGNRYEWPPLTPAPAEAEDALTLEEGAVTIMDGDPNVVTTIELTDPDTGKTRRVVIPPAGSAQ